jgi:hypothetical protein
MRDNLYRAREDGDEYSSLPGEPRKTSFFLAAQMHPLATAAILAGVGAAITALLMPKHSGYSRPRMQRRVVSPARPQPPVQHTSGNGHDRQTLGPGHLSQRDAPPRRVQPRH